MATAVTAAPATGIGVGCLFKESFLDGPVPAVLPPLCSRWANRNRLGKKIEDDEAMARSRG